MAFKYFNFNKISPFWKKLSISLIFLAIAGWGLSRLVEHKDHVLTTAAQDKSDDLSPIDRVKSLYTKPIVKNDPIADISTQKLIASTNPNFNGVEVKTSSILNSDKMDDKTKYSIKLNSLNEIKNSQNTSNSYENNSNNKDAMITNMATNKTCDAYDAALGKCDLGKEYQEKMTLIAQNIEGSTKPSLSDTSVQHTSSPEKDNLNKAQNLPPQQPPIEKSSLSLLIASVGKTEMLAGRTSDIGGASNQIKSGTTVLAVLNEAKTITSSGEQFASASIIGAPFDHKKFPDGVTVLLKMKLNDTQDGIQGQIVSCSSRRNNDKTIVCAGQLEDINGETALRGEVYSSTGWQIITTAFTTFLSGMSLAKITTSATQMGVTQDQTTTNALYQSLSGAITSMGQQIAASFARSGTQISIPGRVVVRILFTQDSVW